MRDQSGPPGRQLEKPFIVYAHLHEVTRDIIAELHARHGEQRQTSWSCRDGWGRLHHEFGLNRDEYNTCLDGAPNAYLLHLTAVNRLNEPLPLRHLREQAPFQPPQGFRYVAAADPAGLHDLVQA